MGVDLTTITRAYTEARNRGLIASFSGRGSYVLGASNVHESGRIDLAMNIPPQPADGSLAERIKESLEELLARQPIEALSQYQDGSSNRSAIHAAQAWMRPALEGLDTEHLLICAGAQAAICGILTSTLRRDDTVLCEPLTYPGFLHAARHMGLRVQPVDIDHDGVIPDAIERLHRQTGAQLIYLNPTSQNPTASMMSEGRRSEVASVLRRLQMTLIEDDPYRYLLNDAPAPLVTYTGGTRTYYLASLSKCLWPSLRTAFVLPPAGQGDTGLQAGLRTSGLGSSFLVSIAEQWIRSGAARHLAQEVQREARARQTLARSLLPETARGQLTGIHTWLPLPSHWNQQLFAHALEELGITVACADSFSASPETNDAVRISLGGAINQTVLRQALARIAVLIKEDRRRGARTIV
ncbi:GntR family transcriptional regulator [Paraburkholderia hospita]|uniref:GntR family transcriptional regulator n=1 Tax=Paraburkholderia hospita TaxID=169430 RepID=A0ABN0FTU0_9BURK|nr:GntR family transcriptional regulator [Paraburkholderia hospita]